ncbi:MAG: hypothetical protein IID48_21715 [Proteobacteria bacterium]|nr:hypothetical protein [Pseudomonadota bacterium]
MQNALGLMGDQAIMVGITLALGIGGVLALFMALFWPARWHLPYRMEVAFVVLLAGLAVYADANSAGTYQAYEADLPDEGALSGALAFDAAAAGFDRHIKVYAFQWGFLFFDEDGAASRNAVKVAPGAKVLFTILANDVIHGFNIPVARLTTEFDPGEARSIWIRAPEAPGKYLIQCLNYCGLGHSQMKAWLVVGEPGDAGQG